jgi:hypothetical protein
VWYTKDVDVSQAKKDPNEVFQFIRARRRVAVKRGTSFRHILSLHTYNFVVYSAVKHLRTILSLVLTNSDIRKLLFDFSLVGRDLLARGASKAAEGLRPDSECLAHDDSAPQDQFVTEGGHTAGLNETPVVEGKVLGTGHTVSQHPKDDLGTGSTVKTENGDVKSGQQIYEEGRDQALRLKEQGQGAAQEQIDEAQRRVFFPLLLAFCSFVSEDTLTPSAISKIQKLRKRGVMDKVRGMHDGLSDRMPLTTI